MKYPMYNNLKSYCTWKLELHGQVMSADGDAFGLQVLPIHTTHDK